MQGTTQRALKAEKVKTAILDAAIELFARGYDTVSIQKIATAAGCKHSLLMYHFGTKEKLWEQAAMRLVETFDQRLEAYLADMPEGLSDQDRVFNHLACFIKALRDIPEYGQILFSETSRETERLQWLHRHFFPAVVRQAPLSDGRIDKTMMQTTLLRNAVAGAALFSVVAGPQLAQSAKLEGSEPAEELYPMSDRMAEQLARMLTGFVLAESDHAVDG